MMMTMMASSSSPSSLLFLSIVVVVIGLLAGTGNVRADLPIHCLNVQVAGEWVFELGRDDGDNTRHCGHKVPDTNADHFTAHGFDLEVVRQYKVNLTEPNVAIDEHGKRGTWTMVYDEGFEVLIDGKKFFAFNKYVPKTPESLLKDDVDDYTSICDETLVGWYHNDDGTHWGCYHGKKIGGGGGMQQLEPRFRQVNNKRHQQQVLSPVARHTDNNNNNDDNNNNNNAADSRRMLEEALWEPDYSFIEEVNTNEASTWRAGVHDQFLGKRMGEMLKLIGYRTATGAKNRQAHEHDLRHHRRVPRQRRQSVSTDHPTLPASFDWRNHDGKNYDSPVKNQGNCGSCFAMATISVAEAQVRIQTKLRKKTLLSTQAIVSCSVYNQGCEGGYPYLVGKHAMDYGLVPKACMKYSGSDEECRFTHGPECPNPPPTFVATNYTYVGGYYGACTEHAMMEEIYANGPIMVAFDAPSSLFYYTGGIYTGPAAPHEGPHLKYLHPWEKTNHAVVAVGWGVEKGHKYWIVKNTWGHAWGENGYFRIRRGTDECALESMAVSIKLRMPSGF